MTASTEKAEPIPAEVRATADAIAATWHLLSYPSKVVLSDDIARAIMQDRADREARPSLPDSREEQVREDLQRLVNAATEVSRLGAVTGPQWGRLSAAIGRARSRQGGNNG